PSLTSAFHGCFPCPSSLFLRKTVPSIVGVEKVILSPFVARFVAGIPNFTRFSQKYRYFPFAFFALKPIATGSPPSSRSEERRVGKECTFRRARQDEIERVENTRTT